MLIGAVLSLGVVLVRGSSDGELIVEQDVPLDVQAELDATWGRFIEAFAARRTCFADVSVELVRDVLGGDARYVTSEARIEIEIPTTPARFSESLVHELGHHVERTCSEFADMKAAMLARLGVSDDAWTGGDVWEQTPSEIWAEGVVGLVNGERVLHGDEMPLDSSVVALIEAWAQGHDIGSVGS